MPTIISHSAVPLALGLGLGPRVVPPQLLIAGIAACVLPDLDVISFRFHIAYADILGHRGLSHSLAFAAFVAVLAGCSFRALRSTPAGAFWFVLAATASHGVLDAFTNGGLGVALLWPWSTDRYFASFRPIEVAPLSVERLFSKRGTQVLLSELVWVWIPCILVALLLLAVQKRRAKGRD